MLTNPLKWHGGKHNLASRIVGLMPSHIHYVEPFAGGLSVLLAKNPEGVSEVVNDLDGDLTRFWQVLQCESHFKEFLRLVQAVPFSEWEWEEAAKQRRTRGEGDWPSLIDRVAYWFVAVRQSLAGRMDAFASLSRRRTRRGRNEQASAWLTAIEGLPEVHARLKRVVILNRDALEVIRQQDGYRTCFYLDPPYHPSTRAATEVYAHEMTDTDHHCLLALLRNIKGKFLLSGYRCERYDLAAKEAGWNRVDFDVANHAAGGGEKRRMVESVWVNY